jgi:predicted TIM-barrel fold metal-dependent hydrolase
MSTQPFIDSAAYYLHSDQAAITTFTYSYNNLVSLATASKLRNVGPARVRDMRTLNQNFQILSHVPIDAPPRTCQKINDMLHSSIVTNPTRFAALALLPSRDGKETNAELLRCVTKYHFVGGVLGFRGGDITQFDGEVWDEV